MQAHKVFPAIRSKSSRKEWQTKRPLDDGPQKHCIQEVEGNVRRVITSWPEFAKLVVDGKRQIHQRSG
jgi:hypothetical protein